MFCCDNVVAGQAEALPLSHAGRRKVRKDRREFGPSP